MFIIGCLSAVWAALLVVRYRALFSGDPEIHIIFAKNLLSGHVPEFNPGYKSGGETSPLYMLLVVCGYELLGNYVPYAMKLLAFASLATICLLLYRANISAAPLRRYVIALFAVRMPFFVFQASLAMENMLFAAAVLFLVHLWSQSGRGFVAAARYSCRCFSSCALRQFFSDCGVHGSHG